MEALNEARKQKGLLNDHDLYLLDGDCQKEPFDPQ
jgi:hypothetical protein